MGHHNGACYHTSYELPPTEEGLYPVCYADDYVVFFQISFNWKQQKSLNVNPNKTEMCIFIYLLKEKEHTIVIFIYIESAFNNMKTKTLVQSLDE